MNVRLWVLLAAMAAFFLPGPSPLQGESLPASPEEIAGASFQAVGAASGVDVEALFEEVGEVCTPEVASAPAPLPCPECDGRLPVGCGGQHPPHVEAVTFHVPLGRDVRAFTIGSLTEGPDPPPIPPPPRRSS